MVPPKFILQQRRTRVPALRRMEPVPSDHGDETRLCRLCQTPSAGQICHSARHVALPRRRQSPPHGIVMQRLAWPWCGAVAGGYGGGLWRGVRVVVAG